MGIRHILQRPAGGSKGKMPLWLVLHGAYARAEQSIQLFGQAAQEHNALLLAPQASRPCGEGFCWSFARDAAAIDGLLDQVHREEQVDEGRAVLIGFSMGCTMGGWVLARHPRMFGVFAALSMGSAFEPWEHDDGGIDRQGLKRAAGRTRILLAVDQKDPYGCGDYFAANRDVFLAAGLQVETLAPEVGVHDVTDEMKDFVLGNLPG